MREACELIVSKLSVQWKTPKISSVLFFFSSSPAAFMSFMVLFLSCSPHIPPLYLWLFQCCLCPKLNSALASAVPLPAGDGERGIRGCKGSSFFWKMILF